MSKTAKWFLAIVAVFIFMFGIGIIALISWLFAPESEDSTTGYGDKVAIIELNETLFYSESIVRQLKKYRENKSVKAIVLRLNSPGGDAVAGQEIYEAVRKTCEDGTPVVVSMGSVAASAAYYIAVGADVIVANPATITGSIGVIMQFLHYGELMKKIGVDESTFKSGKFKDAGSPFRKPTPEEQQYFTEVVRDVYNQFVDVVVRERNLDRKHVVSFADGKIFTGRVAYEQGFIDTLGTYEDAIAIAAKLGGITGKPSIIVERKQKRFWEEFWGEAASSVDRIRNSAQQPLLQYRMNTP
jgi:protease-4